MARRLEARFPTVPIAVNEKGAGSLYVVTRSSYAKTPYPSKRKIQVAYLKKCDQTNRLAQKKASRTYENLQAGLYTTTDKTSATLSGTQKPLFTSPRFIFPVNYLIKAKFIGVRANSKSNAKKNFASFG